jgi:hypothetical protein
MDVIAGILTLIAVPFVWRLIKRMSVRYAWLLPTTFAIIGLDSIIDALLPLSCAPSVNLQCNLANTHSFITEAHLVESTLTGMLIFIAPLIWWWRCRGKHNLIAQMSVWFLLMQIACGIGILAVRVIDVNIVGFLQRIYELSIGMWMALIVGAPLGYHYARKIDPVGTEKPKDDPLDSIAAH